jgi:hypothetical protein
LQQVLPSYADVWPFLQHARKGNSRNDLMKDGREERDVGYTFDSEVNKMFSKRERMRYDRVLARSGQQGRGGGGVGVVASDISLVGVQALPTTGEGLLLSRSQSQQQQVWPSDHFGLLTTFQILPDHKS